MPFYSLVKGYLWVFCAVERPYMYTSRARIWRYENKNHHHNAFVYFLSLISYSFFLQQDEAVDAVRF